MAQESFSNPEVASLLNEFFVPILIDRDERPDLDVIYMNYVQAVSSSGGWPLNLFLTPNLEPVFGGTFWPGPGSVRRLQTETGEEVMDFLSIVQKVGKTWRDQEARCRKEATEVVGQLREFAAEGVLGTRGITSAPLAPQTSSTTPAAHEAASATHTGVSKASELDLDQLEEAYTHIAGTFDPVYGGFGLAPKFPTPPKLAFLLRLKEFPSEVQDVVGTQECQHAQDMALDTLRKMAKSALRDHIGGTGFCRCSVTPDWSIPNFEKMVVDNALLLTLYLDAWRLSGGKEDSEFFDVVLELVDYLITAPVALPEGGFASGEAAGSFYKRGDREMREGAYYLWTKREFDSVVDVEDKLASQVVGAYYGIMEDGNVDEGHDPNDDFISENIVRIRASPEELGKHFGIPVDTVRKLIANAKDALRAKREKERVRPEVDDKVVTGWTSLVISSLARAGIALKDVRPLESDKCLVTAKKASVFVKEKLWDSETGVLARIYKNGKGGEGFADDYAYAILGLLDLFDATGDESLVEFAEKVHGTYQSNNYQLSPFYHGITDKEAQNAKSPCSTTPRAHSTPRPPPPRTPSSASRTAWTPPSPPPTPSPSRTSSACPGCWATSATSCWRTRPWTRSRPRCCSTPGCSRGSWRAS